MASNASYKGRRLSLPRLCNQYAALQESSQYTFETGQLLEVTNSPDNMNTLFKFEPQFTPAAFIDGSPLCNSMFNRYGQFRIRKVCVRFTESVVNAQNMGRSDVWVYWCPNHAKFDEEESKGNTFSVVADLAEASRVQHICSQPGRSFQIECIPQVIFQSTVTIGGLNTDLAGDGKMPWMDCADSNKNSTKLRMPIVYIRRPYIAGSNVPVHNPTFQVMLVAVVEFRNLEDDN